MKFRALTAVLALMAMPAAAYADQASTVKPATEASADLATTMADDDVLRFITTQPAESLFSSDFIGYSVYGAQEEKIGDINDLLIDGSGGVEAVVIGVGGLLGVGEKDVAVPLESLQVDFVEDRYVISIAASEEDLNTAPAFVRSDGTTSDRLGAFERTLTRARNDADKAIDAVSTRAEELYEKAANKAEDATEAVKEAVQ